MLDKEGTGKISKEQLKNRIGNEQFFSEKPESYWESLIKEADINGDGTVIFLFFFYLLIIFFVNNFCST